MSAGFVRIPVLLLLAVFSSAAGAASWCDESANGGHAGLEPADVADDWFGVYAVAEGVFAISEPRQAEGVNSSLIVGSQRAVLFDSVLGVSNISAVVKQLTGLPVTWKISARVEEGEQLDLGGRVVEILRTPGHTPDAIRLLDREIYLWAPETSVADYMTSVDRLVRVGSNLTRLLTAHGSPVAEPRRLIELQEALRAIKAGNVVPEQAAENRRLFRFHHFSILMEASGD